MFLITKEIRFCYGHRLLNYSGKCRYLHGHNGRALVTLCSETLDEVGMVCDFTELKDTLGGWIGEHLDHKMILCERDPLVPLLKDLGEPVYVLAENPTAEAIAKLIFDQAARLGYPVLDVTLFETETSCACYRRSSPRGAGEPRG
jgi:6-pyruvoyltetrahydropterin/6-carboxytetrahydropterin synthase